MDLFDSKRQERLEAARKAATASKEASLKFLIEAGILFISLFDFLLQRNILE